MQDYMIKLLSLNDESSMSKYAESNLSALPLAEHIDPDLLRAWIEAPKDDDPKTQVFLACDRIDLGIATQDGDEAQKGLNLIELVLRDLPEAWRCNPSFVQASSLLAFRETIFHRIEHRGEPFSERVMEQTRRASAFVLRRARTDTGFKLENARSNLCELIAIGALARQQKPNNFPIAGTTREEKNELASENHDGYTIEWGLNAAPQKWGMNIKAWNSSARRHSPKPHPTITSLRVLSILGDVLEKHNPAFRGVKRNLRHDQQRNYRVLCYAAELLEKDSLKEPLGATDKNVLHALTQSFQWRMDETKAYYALE